MMRKSFDPSLPLLRAALAHQLGKDASMSTRLPYKVVADGHTSRFSNLEQAQAFAAFVSDEMMTGAEVFCTRPGGGIIGQYVDGRPTPEFAGREDAVHRR